MISPRISFDPPLDPHVGIFASGPLVKLLHDYGDLCRKNGQVPKKVILTFAPCGRAKTMTFIKWLGMYVPEDVEKRILGSESPVAASVDLLKEILTTILRDSAGSGVPLGINVESLSIFKEEIDAAHELFQSLQALLLNSRGSPWAVRWFCVRRSLTYAAARASEDSLELYEAHAEKVAELNKSKQSKNTSLVKRVAKVWSADRLVTIVGLSTAALLGIVIGRGSLSR